MQELKRLHITPFNLDLLPVVLPQNLQGKASNISFHTIDNFPENNYGFLDLPVAEADKLKKRIHGCLLKGRKMKVEEAKRRKTSQADEEKGPLLSSSKKTRSYSNRTNEGEALPAIELPKKRKVKRGWTEADDPPQKGKDKSKKTAKKAKTKDTSITGEAECLFKTKLPIKANAEGIDQNTKKRKRKRDQDIVVHEFANTQKHASFLKDDAGHLATDPATEFVAGKGSVDKNGNINEKPRRRTRTANPAQKVHVTGEADDLTKDHHPTGGPRASISPGPKDDTNGTSSEVTSSSGSETSGNEAEEQRKKQEPKGLGISSVGDNSSNIAQIERLSVSRSSASPEPRAQEPPTSPPQVEKERLEAIFKRPKAAASHSQTPKKPQLEVSTSFSFLDADVGESGNGDANMLLPHTPFTQQDFRHRRVRSAAPTPDTALPGKTFADVLTPHSDEGVESDEDDNEQATAGAGDQSRRTLRYKKIAEGQPESDFAKEFWERRGEMNRGWKRRKREAAKEQRMLEKKEKRG